MYSEKEIRNICIILSLTVIIVFLAGIFGCNSIQPIPKIPSEVPAINHIPAPIQKTYPSLSWENTIQPHPERIAWSMALIDEINKRFEHLDKANDTEKFCPKYGQLNQGQKIQVWGELFVALAYYESGYDPEVADVDVGAWYDKDTWSTGLWQVSAIDREAYNLEKEIPYYSFEDLKKVEPNIKLALALMARQIDRYDVILMPTHTNLYWATLYPGGKYDESQNIIKRVKRLTFCN